MNKVVTLFFLYSFTLLTGCQAIIKGAYDLTAKANPAFTRDPLFEGNVGYWSLGEAAGSGTLADSSAVGNTATNGGTTILGSPGRTVSQTSGSFNGGVEPNISIPAIASYSALTQITVSAWINTSTPSASAGLILNGDNNWIAQRSFQFRIQSNKLSCILFFVNNSTVVNILSINPVTDGLWHHVACTYDGTAVSVYIDGVMDNTVAETRVMNNVAPMLNIGAFYGGGFRYTGSTSDVGLWNRALSGAEIVQLFQR